jgi:DNA-binding winged helix-turn-helix (wHTH) protein/TolB-like protein
VASYSSAPANRSLELSDIVARYQFDQFEFDPADGRLQRTDGRDSLTLRPQVARLLLALLEAPRTVIGRETLRDAVWDQGVVVDFESGLAAVVRELRQSLEKLGGHAGLLETVPRRGYRLHADVVAMTDRSRSDRAADRPDRPRNARRTLSVAGAAAILVLIVAAAWWLRAPGPAPVAEEWTLAVLPFELFGDAPEGRARVELLMADALLRELWQAELHGVALVGRATLLPYEGREDRAEAVARDLGVSLLIEGSALREGADWTVTARLLQMPGGRIVWSESVGWSGVDVLPVGETAARLVDSLERDWAAGLVGLPSP